MQTAPASSPETAASRWSWHESWLNLPAPEEAGHERRTHGVTVLRDGRIVVFHQSVPAVLIYSREGELLAKWGRYPGAHGLTRVMRGGEEALWLTDETLAVAELADLSGRVLARLERPDHPVYREKKFIPTWVAEEAEDGRPVRLWLADGYGSHLVHAYDGEGRYEFSLSGGGAGEFNCPHGIAVDPRPGRAGRLLVADRGNRRVQEFDRAGNYLGCWGADFLHSPDGFDFRGEHCVIAELLGRVTVVDGRNRLVEYLGEQKNATELPGWPNVEPALVRPGFFNSPHAAAWGQRGEVHVVEWIKGGRVTRLEPES